LKHAVTRLALFVVILSVFAVATCSQKPPARMTSFLPRIVKLVSYFPDNAGWEYMWRDWQPAKIDADFASIRALGFNTVRLIVPVDEFGFPNPTADHLSHLASAISMAATHGLRVQLTLFDLWNSYTRIPASKQWAHAIVAPFRSDARIQSIEVKNEVDPRSAEAIGWAAVMIQYVRGEAGTIPITISPIVGDVGFLRSMHDGLGSAQPDFYSYHYYGPASDAYTTFARARDVVAPLKLVIGETGYSTGDASGPATANADAELAQEHYLITVERAAWKLGIGTTGIWLYQDFVPGALGPTPNKSYHFGLVRADGSMKPIADWIKTFLAQIPDSAFLRPSPVAIGSALSIQDLIARARHLRSRLAGL